MILVSGKDLDKWMMRGEIPWSAALDNCMLYVYLVFWLMFWEEIIVNELTFLLHFKLFVSSNLARILFL